MYVGCVGTHLPHFSELIILHYSSLSIYYSSTRSKIYKHILKYGVGRFTWGGKNETIRLGRKLEENYRYHKESMDMQA